MNQMLNAFQITHIKLFASSLQNTGEYTGKVIAFPKKNSGIIVQLDIANITCLVRVPARFNNYPHYMQNVLIKITEINETKKLIYGYLMRVFYI